VAQCHMRFHPDQEHVGDQLTKKFNKRAKTKMGTGDPSMPPDVHEAKEIQGLIIEKSEGVTARKATFDFGNTYCQTESSEVFMQISRVINR